VQKRELQARAVGLLLHERIQVANMRAVSAGRGLSGSRAVYRRERRARHYAADTKRLAKPPSRDPRHRLTPFAKAFIVTHARGLRVRPNLDRESNEFRCLSYFHSGGGRLTVVFTV
jgi:hypothetical protein